MLPLCALTLLAFADAETPVRLKVAIGFAEGLSQSETATLEARALDEIIKHGGQGVRGPAPKTACIKKRSCMRRWLDRTEGAFIIDAVRVGPILMVTSRLYDSEGALRHQAERDLDLETLSRATSVLGAEAGGHIRGMARAVPGLESTSSETPPSPPPPDPGAHGPPGRVVESSRTSPQPADVTTQKSGWLPWLVSAGGFGIVTFGAVAALAGLSVALWQTQIAYTVHTPGDQKAMSLIAAPFAVGLACLGTMGIAAGSAVAFGALLIE